MGVLEQINQMRNQGISEDEIISRLEEQNVSPKAIHEALGQSRIKEAISDTGSLKQMREEEIGGSDFYDMPQSPYTGAVPYPKSQEVREDEEYAPQPQEEYAPQTRAYPPVSQEFYPQEGYEEYYAGSSGTDTMIEIAEQVFSDKIRKLQTHIEELNEFRVLTQTKVTHMSERLNRIESTIDKLQAAILQKIGSYGGTLESIKKEMSMMQESFGKMIPSLAEKHSHQPIHKTTQENVSPVARKKISKTKR